MAAWHLIRRIERLAPVRAAARFGRTNPTLLAAAVSFNVFFSLAPLSLLFLAVGSLLGTDLDVRPELISALGTIAPPEVVELVNAALDSAAATLAGSEGLVILGSLVVALYSGSRATVAVVRALTLIEEEPDERSFWRKRLIGMGLTLIGGAALLLAMVLIVMGATLAAQIGDALSAPWFDTVASLVAVPIAGSTLFVYLLAAYRWGPPRPLPGSGLGALIGTVGALAISWGFSWFLGEIGGLGSVVGAVATLAVLLLWLYLGAFVIFTAAFVARELMGRSMGEAVQVGARP